MPEYDRHFRLHQPARDQPAFSQTAVNTIMWLAKGIGMASL